MPLQATSGAASYDAFGGGAPAGGGATYIEDVFSTWLYTGTGASQTITNNIDLSTKGGLVWIKSRSAATDHRLTDTVRGATKSLASNSTTAEITESTGLTAFGTTGFTIGADADYNTNAATYASWTFREQEKFFDIVTYLGDGTEPRNIAHNLGSVPGCMIVKSTSATGGWRVYHRSLGATQYLQLQSTNAAQTYPIFYDTAPTSTVFTVGVDANASGVNYIAYLFAHDAGGFGLTGTDNVISCGSFTTDGSGNFSVNLGYEPQWILAKQSTGSANPWFLFDNMRSMSNTAVAALYPNSSSAEDNFSAPYCVPNATGFYSNSGGFFDASQTVVYIAIRRGPMKVPTVGTSVYQAVTRTGNSPTVNSITSVGFPPDSIWQKRVSGSTASSNVFDRLRGRYFLAPAFASAEAAANTSSTRDLISFDMTGFSVGEQFSSELNANTRPEVYWNFGRAPGFFDEVCYTATSSSASVTHNLTVRPEMIIYKTRSVSDGWYVMVNQNGYGEINGGGGAWGGLGNGNGLTNIAQATSTTINNLGGFFYSAGQTIIAYLFATCAGVSKVGSYTGNGSTQTIACGFGAGGARFVLLKRTDATGDWYVYDTARGMTVLTDPYLRLNSTGVEVATLGSVTTVSTGFALDATILTAINASGGSYIFLAIA